jgi:hypothetical protein
MRTTGKWAHPLPIPQFGIACADGRNLDLDDLRGHVLRIVAMSDDEAPPPEVPAGVDITTVTLARKQPEPEGLRGERTRDLDCVRDLVGRIG